MKRDIVYYTPGARDDAYPYQIIAAGKGDARPDEPDHTTFYRQHTFIFTLSGRGKIRVADKQFDASVATVTWLDTSQVYAHGCHPDHDHWRRLWFGMSGHGLDALHAHLVGGRGPVHPVSLSTGQLFQDVIVHLKQPEQAKAPMSALLAARLIEALSSHAPKAIETQAPQIEPVLEAVRSGLHLRWTVGKMADLAHRSPSHFHRVFVQAYGVRPMEWVRLERINRAKYLLSTTDLSVAEIGGACGYSDPYHFSRAFSRTAGLPPTGFRNLSDL